MNINGTKNNKSGNNVILSHINILVAQESNISQIKNNTSGTSNDSHTSIIFSPTVILIFRVFFFFVFVFFFFFFFVFFFFFFFAQTV